MNQDNVLVVDNLITGNLQNLKKYFEHNNFKFIDAISKEIFFEENIDFVIHQLAVLVKSLFTVSINTLKSGNIGT